MQRRALLRLGLVGIAGTALGCRPASEEIPQDGLTDAPRVDPPRARPKPPENPQVADEPEPSEPRAEPAPEPFVEQDPPAVVQRIEVVCRESLGLVPARPDTRSHTLGTLTLHHTAVPLATVAGAPARLRGHQRYHQEQDWPDIAYHYAIDLVGNVYELRDPATPGDTFTDYDPSGHFLVVCEGDFDQQQAPDAMLAATADLFAHAAETYGIALETLGGHRDLASTSCPGEALYSEIDAIREAAARRLARGHIELAQLCGGPGDARIAAIEAS